MNAAIKALEEKRKAILADARERNDAITANTDEARTAELEAAHDSAMTEYDKLGEQIAREQRMNDAESEQAEAELRAREAKRPTASGTAPAGAELTEGEVSYRDAFYQMLGAGGQVSELDPEVRAALKRGHVSADPELRVQTAGTTTQGGFTVPSELAGFIVKSLAIWGPMYDPGVTTEIVTASGVAITIPTTDDTAKVVAKTTEGTALTDDGGVDVVFGSKTLDAFMFDTEFVKFSYTLAQDSAFNIEQLLGELLGERLARRANTELTTGDGTGDPNGIVTASGLGLTAASATAITWDELIELEHSVNPAYRASPKARYMLADGTLELLRKLKDGDGRYLWQDGNVQSGAPASLNGKPYSINAAMPAATTGLKSVIFGDFGKYYVRKVGAPVIGVMRERFWPDLGIAGLIRLDGELGDAAAVKHLIQL